MNCPHRKKNICNICPWQLEISIFFLMEGSPRVLGWTGPRSLQAMEVGAEVCAVGSRPGLPGAMRVLQTCGENEGIWPGYHWTCATATLVLFFIHNYVNRMNQLKRTQTSHASESEIQWGSEGLRSMLSSVEAQGFPLLHSWCPVHRNLCDILRPQG